MKNISKTFPFTWKATFQLFFDLLIWTVSFALVSIGFNLFVTRENPLGALFYFLFLSFLILQYYKKDFKKLLQKASRKQSRLLILLFLFHFGTYYIVHSALKSPSPALTTNTISFLEMDFYFLWIKPFEIALQQIFILVLIFLLQKNKIPLTKALFIVFFLFGGMHLFLFLNLPLSLALYLTFFALCASYIFTLFITQLKNGFLYSYLLHLGFYQISALFFWFFL